MVMDYFPLFLGTLNMQHVLMRPVPASAKLNKIWPHSMQREKHQIFFIPLQELPFCIQECTREFLTNRQKPRRAKLLIQKFICTCIVS